jgi:hypothetical protein
MKYFFTILIFTLIFSSANADEFETYTLKWVAPKSFSNGEKLSAKHDLNAYKLYYGSSREQVRENSLSIDPSLTEFSISKLDKFFVRNSSIIYIAMTSVSEAGIESDLSEIIFFLP